MKIREYLSQIEPEMVLLDPPHVFDSAIVGVSSENQVIYSAQLLVEAYVLEHFSVTEYATMEDCESQALSHIRDMIEKIVPHMGQYQPIIMHEEIIENFC